MREALGFLTVLGGARTPTGRALRWFPLVGAAVGAAVGAVWWVAGEGFPVLVAAGIAVVADLALTGLLHVDGLADAADGLLPHAERSRRLEIMRRPDVGAFGVAVVGACLLLRFAAFGSQLADILLVTGIWCAARTVVAVVPAWVPYAREHGVATAMLDGRVERWPLVALAPAVALAVLGVGVEGGAAVAATVVVTIGVVALARARLGGFTGDVLGAAIVLGETAGLVVAAARW
jgi:adenosylcobinamide-GDP ribazoletransferase